ncbi:MAG: hypothetical protein JO287_27555 [Pseudonocardiales bacterium]|nr:hypothetical protein [Pseudonocardiales bacterium]
MFKYDRGSVCIDMKYFAVMCAALFIRIDHRPAVMAIVAALAGAVTFGLAHRAMLDDSMITLSYARTLAQHGQWGMVDGLTSNSATSVLNVLLLASIIAVIGHPVVAVGVLLMATMAAVAWWAARIAEDAHLPARAFPAAIVGLLLVNPVLVSTIGLETYLGMGLVIGLARYALAGRAMLTGVLVGLVTLTRPDLLVFALVIVFGFPAARRRLACSALAAVALAAPWYVFSWWALGSAIPDTFVFKTVANHFDSGDTFLDGPIMWARLFAAASLLGWLPALAGGACLLGWLATTVARCRSSVAGTLATVFGLGGIVHFAVFATLGTPPYQWYYGPVIGGLTVCAATTAMVAPWRRWMYGLIWACVALTAAFDLHHGVPWTTTPIYSNWATTAQYAAAASGVAAATAGDNAVGSPGEIGALAFYCDCRIVDLFSDRGDAANWIEERMRRAGPLMRWLLALNYRHLDRHPAIRRTSQLTFEPAGQGLGAGSWPINSPVHGPHTLVLRRIS